MKEGWKEKHFGDICESRLGKTLNASSDTGEKRPYLCAVNVKWDTIDMSIVKSAPFDIDEIEKFTVQKGDLLVCEGGDTGRAAIWENEEPIQYQNALHRIRFKENTIIPRYGLHYLRHLKLSGILDKEYSHGATILHLVTKSLYSIPIEYPSLPEQQRIVDILDAEFAKIDALKANAEKNLQNAKDLFQAALKKELEPKEGWKTVRLNDIFNFIDYRGATPNKLSDGIPLITAKNVKMGFIDYSIKDFISKEEYATRQSRGISHKGDILITTEAPLGNAAIADKDIYSAGQRVITLQQYPTQNHQILNKFYLYYIISPKFQDELKRQATGLTALGIKASRLKEMKIQVLPYKEQQSIASHLDTLNKKCTTLQSNYEKTIALCDDMKQALLRKAFNGEL